MPEEIGGLFGFAFHADAYQPPPPPPPPPPPEEPPPPPPDDEPGAVADDEIAPLSDEPRPLVKSEMPAGPLLL